MNLKEKKRKARIKITMKNLKKQAKGITLIALVVTIIVLLILAGVAISLTIGQNGIFARAQNAVNVYMQATENEATELEQIEQEIGKATGEEIIGNLDTLATKAATKNTTVQDSLGNKVIVPEGFKVIIPDDVSLENYNVEDGVVIEDVTHGATSGSQFVWIPVGTIHRKDKEDVTITLSRYTFAEDGTPTDQGSKAIAGSSGYNFQELNTGRGNTTAKENIESEEEGFRKSAIANGGYYIGRYEARTDTERKAKTDLETQITVKPEEYVYNYVTQTQAASLSRNMYNTINFESDLMNSYAWDTAILFIQECSEDEDYSGQRSLNTGSLAPRGTNNLSTKDVVCNIYDMASNCIEWTTETYNRTLSPLVHRGGLYGISSSCHTAGRYSGTTSYDGDDDDSFRPLLYLQY